jgi:ATP-binding cassette subfamily B multidrug efflux pump
VLQHSRVARGGIYARLWEHQSGGFLGDESDEDESIITPLRARV